ncbi:MAG: hypothetical protein JO108_24380, partial [Acidobacteriaceae bacterium]|nr:hypothetical protein [Acidobacteriaceae bacterium]
MKLSSHLMLLCLVCAPCVIAHPMGNFSVSHYAKFVISESDVKLEYALDLAEIPTFELLRTWELDRDSPS